MRRRLTEVLQMQIIAFDLKSFESDFLVWNYLARRVSISI